MEENRGTKNKRKILWAFLGITLIILIAGALLLRLLPSMNESASNEIAITKHPYNRPTQEIVTPKYLLPDIDIGDGGLITKDPCGPPCFWNITPGVTTLAEVYQIIEEKGIMDACEIEEGDYIDCRFVFTVYFSEKDDTVSMIDLNIQEQRLEMRDVINKMGPPNRVFTQRGEIPDALEFLDMLIYYDDITTEIRLETQDYEEGMGYYNVSETTIVIFIRYYDEEGYKNDNYYRHALPWHGYGEYLGERPPYP